MTDRPYSSRFANSCFFESLPSGVSHLATATSFKPGTLTLASFLLDDPHQWREDVESGRLGILRKVQRHWPKTKFQRQDFVRQRFRTRCSPATRSRAHRHSANSCMG